MRGWPESADASGSQIIRRHQVIRERRYASLGNVWNGSEAEVHRREVSVWFAPRRDIQLSCQPTRMNALREVQLLGSRLM
jgi:hypothetical protein